MLGGPDSGSRAQWPQKSLPGRCSAGSATSFSMRRSAHAERASETGATGAGSRSITISSAGASVAMSSVVRS